VSMGMLSLLNAQGRAASALIGSVILNNKSY
jgi:hypothetical protein